MEWMTEFDAEDILPDQDFYDTKHPERALSGRLFLLMSNQAALAEMLRLWNTYQTTPAAKFAHGYGKWKTLFQHLRTVRVWGVEDRLHETGIIQAWEEDLRGGLRTQVFFEAELWFRADEAMQQRAEGEFRRAVEASGGRTISSAVLPQIAYHGVIGELPAASAQRLIGGEQIQVLQCEDVMFVRPAGQAIVPPPTDAPGIDLVEDTGHPPPIAPQPPRLALLDGLPLENHLSLRGRLTVDDPDDWAADYPANERIHGTAMASLIVWGDLDRRDVPLSRPLYVRPILRPDGRDLRAPRNEAMPHDVCVPDLIHRAVRRIFEAANGSPAVAPSIRVVNLSIGDPFRPFDGTISPFARILDWLSWRYQVLFLVSSGNYGAPIQLSNTNGEVARLAADELSAEVFRGIHRHAHIRRILSPAEAVNAVTIGASHTDLSTGPPEPHRVDPYPQINAPSPINAVGPGFRRSIKPELLLDGGRQLYTWRIGAAAEAATIVLDEQTGRPPGIKVAAPGAVAGNVAATRYTRGTSNATALGVRSCELISDVIDSLGNRVPQESEVVLTKTLLAHGASWADDATWLNPLLQEIHPNDNLREQVARYLGYGKIELGKVLSCSDSRVTVIGTGQISDEEGHVYTFPLPPTLSGVRGRRRVAITLGWLSPINPQHRNYRKAALWFSSPDSPLAVDRVCADYKAVRRGTLQHEIFEGEDAVAFVDGNSLTVKVNCREDAGKLTEQVPYAIAVTLEVAEELAIPVYEEVRVRLRVAVPVRPA